MLTMRAEAGWIMIVIVIRNVIVASSRVDSAVNNLGNEDIRRERFG